MAHRKHDETSTISRRTFLKTGAAAAAAGSFSAGVENIAHAVPAPKQATGDLFDQLRDAPTTLIIDALSRLGYDRTKLAMSQEVRPVVPVKGTAIGPAVITKYEPSREPTTTDDILKYVFQPVDDAPPGAMWVTAAGTDEILSMFGDVIVLACQKLGLSGLVTDGGCRDIEGMLEDLHAMKRNDVLLLHGCCHNPTGADLTNEQWDVVLELAQERGFTPFIDVAYLGFGDGLDEDAYGIRLLAENLPEVVIAASCSKNFGLYRERVGLAAIITEDAKTRDIVQGQIQSVARGSYSMPPSYGGALVDIILSDTSLKKEWMSEVNSMRNRMQSLRTMLVDKLEENGAQQDFSFLNTQKGMFSFLCITPEQVREMRDKHSVYFVGSSRINVAGINQQNVDTLARALVSVL